MKEEKDMDENKEVEKDKEWRRNIMDGMNVMKM